MVGPVPAVGFTTSTSIQIFWASTCVDMDRYEIMWERDTTKKCSDIKMANTTQINNFTSFTITGLEEDSHYIITLTASTMWAAISSSSVKGMTAEAGKKYIV